VECNAVQCELLLVTGKTRTGEDSATAGGRTRGLAWTAEWEEFTAGGAAGADEQTWRRAAASSQSVSGIYHTSSRTVRC